MEIDTKIPRIVYDKFYYTNPTTNRRVRSWLRDFSFNEIRVSPFTTKQINAALDEPGVEMCGIRHQFLFHNKVLYVKRIS